MDIGLVVGVVAALIVFLLVRGGSALDRGPRADDIRERAEANGFRTWPNAIEAVETRMPACATLAIRGPIIDSYWEKSESGRWLLFAEMYHPETRRRSYWGHPGRINPEREFTVVCMQQPDAREPFEVASGPWTISRSQEWIVAWRTTDFDHGFDDTLADARAAIERALAESAAQPLQPVRGR